MLATRSPWLVAILACAGCAQSSNAAPPEPARSRPESEHALNGTWRWSLVTQKDGARQIEAEIWHIAAKNGVLKGTCDRTVTYLSLDGVPFECSQTLTYQQQVTYRFEGSYRGRELEIEEIGFDPTPSPCDDGKRRMTTYQGTFSKGRVTLKWNGGEQTLVRHWAPAGSEPARPADAQGADGQTATGSWRWQSRNRQRDIVRVEIEQWELSESDTGRIAGSVLRTVTIFDAHGRRFECSGDTFYRYRDRYTVIGRRTGQSVSVTETAVAPEAHPCVKRQDRHLDAATGTLSGGTLSGGYLVLTWRGNRRQVLHRSGQ